MYESKILYDVKANKAKAHVWPNAKINGKWKNAAVTSVGSKTNWQVANGSASYKSAYHIVSTYSYTSNDAKGEFHKFTSINITPPMPNQKINLKIGSSRL